MTALTRLDKAAVGTTAAAAAFKVLLWSVGATLDSAEWWLPYVRWAFALVSFVAFDLVVLAVVADQRAHGRRWLGTATMVCAALLSGGVALHVAGVVVWPWLHAGPAALLLLLALHLSDTRGAQVSRRPAQLRALVRRLVREVRTLRAQPRAPVLLPAHSETVEIAGRRVNVSRLAREMGKDRTAVYRLLDKCAEEAA